jgi:hypothetical protein
MLTNKFEPVSESTLGYNGYWSYGGANSPDTSGIIDPPNCSTSPSWCFDNWGVDSFWGLPSFVGIKTYEAGKLTAGVAFRNTDKSIVAFSDGSVRKMSPGALSAGTNWTKTTNASAIVTTDESKYLWDDK